MTDFPKLQPAFTILVSIDPPQPVGSASRGTPLAVVPMVGGTIKSEQGFEPKLDAEFVGPAMDVIHNDPSGKHMRLDATGVVKNKSDDALVHLHYTGVIDITPGVAALLSGSPEAKTTDFGNGFTHVTFETGSESLQALETSVFVASGRFVYEKGKPLVVEYKVSKVIKG
ncbi:MAG: hypothetical protein M1827_006558 [Pycnora praestabilis]|nr:MAG: hypothetical protein M1827_006558 [Pycnora praestabilis]